MFYDWQWFYSYAISLMMLNSLYNLTNFNIIMQYFTFLGLVLAPSSTHKHGHMQPCPFTTFCFIVFATFDLQASFYPLLRNLEEYPQTLPNEPHTRLPQPLSSLKVHQRDGRASGVDFGILIIIPSFLSKTNRFRQHFLARAG